jgi:cytochrome c oxidase subunit 3
MNRSSYIHFFNHISYTAWPFYLAFSIFLLFFYMVLILNKITWVALFNFFTLFLVAHFIFLWFTEMTIESVCMGRYTRKVRSSLIFAFLLFLISEVLIFSGFFWSFFDRFFNGTFAFGNNSFLLGLEPVLWYTKPLYGTIVLVSSGYAANHAHYYLKYGSWDLSVFFSSSSIVLGFLFLYIQFSEYNHLLFQIFDSCLCSSFFLLTGFHGMHVFIGLVFLNAQHQRLYLFHLSTEHHIGPQLALIYWHFVDIIWIFLFVVIYVMCFSATFDVKI